MTFRARSDRVPRPLKIARKQKYGASSGNTVDTERQKNSPRCDLQKFPIKKELIMTPKNESKSMYIVMYTGSEEVKQKSIIDM